MSLVRPLRPTDRSSIAEVLESRRSLPLKGVNWNEDRIIEELSKVSSLGLFEVPVSPHGFTENRLDGLILYHDMSNILEIILIFSKKGSINAGTRLLAGLIAAHGQAEEIWLEAHEDNKSARAFYERQGFVSVASRRGYYSDGKMAINFSLKLNPQLPNLKN